MSQEAEPKGVQADDTIRPALIPVLAGVGGLLLALVMVATALLFLMPVPIQVSVDGSFIIVLVGTVLFLLAVWNDVYIYLTQYYKVEAGSILLFAGFMTKQAQEIDRQNVASVTAIMPFPQRMFGIGSVKISTNDGNVGSMINVRKPIEIAEKLKPKAVPS